MEIYHVLSNRSTSGQSQQKWHKNMRFFVIKPQRTVLKTTFIKRLAFHKRWNERWDIGSTFLCALSAFFDSPLPALLVRHLGISNFSLTAYRLETSGIKATAYHKQQDARICTFSVRALWCLGTLLGGGSSYPSRKKRPHNSKWDACIRVQLSPVYAKKTAYIREKNCIYTRKKLHIYA